MLYIIEQRLSAQNIDKEKAAKGMQIIPISISIKHLINF